MGVINLVVSIISYWKSLFSKGINVAIKKDTINSPVQTQVGGQNNTQNSNPIINNNYPIEQKSQSSFSEKYLAIREIEKNLENYQWLNILQTNPVTLNREGEFLKKAQSKIKNWLTLLRIFDNNKPKKTNSFI